jgi:hypothetical protein
MWKFSVSLTLVAFDRPSNRFDSLGIYFCIAGIFALQQTHNDWQANHLEKNSNAG